MTNFEQYGFWLTLLYIVVRDGVLPLSNKLIPAKVEQQAEKEKREIAVEEREATALEQIGQALTASNLRMSNLETGQNAMIQTLHAQSEAMILQNERLTHLANQQEEHIRVSNEAVMSMMIKTKTMPRKRQIV